MSAVLAWRPNGPRRFPSVGYAAGALYASSSLGPDFPGSPGPSSGDPLRPMVYVVAGQAIYRPRFTGQAPASGKTATTVARLGALGRNTPRAGVDIGSATITFGGLASNAGTAASPRVIGARLQALGSNVAIKERSVDIGATAAPRAAGLVALATGAASTVLARLGVQGAIVTRKNARYGIASVAGPRGQNQSTVGNRVLTTLLAAIGARGGNTVLAATFARRHVREQIRDQYVAALKIGVPAVANRVYASRVYPLAKAELPGIVVYTLGDTIVETTLGEPQLLVRQLELAVQAIVRATEHLDGELDALALAIEQTLSDDQLVGGLANDSDLVETAIDMIDGDQPLGTVTLTYRITYSINEHEPWLPL